VRHVARSKTNVPKSSKKEPLAEGLQIAIPTGPKGSRLWSKLTDEQIVEFAKKLMKKHEITGKKELENADRRLYQVLRERKLLGKVGFEEKNRSWKKMSDEEIINIARKLMREKEIDGRHKLEMTDCGLYCALGKRGLLGKVGFEEKNRSWKKMSDEEILEYAKKVMRKKRIREKGEFRNADYRTYAVLERRKLLGKIDFERKINEKRSWKKMSDNDIVELPRKVIQENRITTRRDLEKADSGLCKVLRKRKLLDRAFAQLDQQIEDDARDAVIDALEAFGAANDNNSAEDDVA